MNRHLFHRLTAVLRKGVLFCLFFLLALPVYALTPDDLYFEDLWYREHLDLEEAWETSVGDDSVVIAILDTGVDLDHPDLEANIWENGGEVAGDGVDNDGNGYVDDVNGYDFVDNDGSPTPSENEGADSSAVSHGTVIAGIAGAVGDNEEGIAGINWEIEIMSVRILDNFGVGNSHYARQGVEYAVANGADVINLSFTGFDFDDAMRKSLEEAYEAGVVVVAAVGNSNDGGIDIDDKPIFPACYGERADQDWILGVASTDENDEKSSFSNYGSECTDISAPGENIFSAIYQSDDWDGYEAYYEYGWSGTSMASPMVAGAAALLLAAHPSLTPDDVRSILRLSVDPVIATGDATGKMGAGRLNVARALELSLSFADTSSESEEVSVDSVISGEDGDSSYRIAVAPEGGGPPTVRVFTNSGSEVMTMFNAYDESFDGGVRLAMGDVDGDGVEEIVVVPGEGDPLVRIFTLEGVLESEFLALDGGATTGLFVATGDTDGDGVEEIAVSTDTGGNARVALYNKDGELAQDVLLPYTDRTGERSVRIALGDVDGDGKDEILTTLGEGHAPFVRVHAPDGTFLAEFLAYAETYQNGVFVASGDLDGDGDDEIVTGTDNGGGPHVQIFDGEGAWLGTFFAYDPLFRGGVRLSVGNLSEWPGASIITAAGPGGGPHIRVYNGYAELIGTFFSDDENDRGGINSAAWGR